MSIPLAGRSIVARHVTGGAETRPSSRCQTFQPMNVNFGLFPPLDAARSGRRGRYKALTDRAKQDFTTWLAPAPVRPDSSAHPVERIVPS